MNRRCAVLLLIAVLAAVGLRAAYALDHADELTGDAAVYHRLGSQLLSDGYLGYSADHLRSWRPPLYPVFLAGVYAVSGADPLAAKLAQSLLAGVVTLLVFLLGRSLLSARAGIAAAFVYALVGYEIRHAVTIYPELLMALLLALFCLSAIRPGGPRQALLLAAVAALLLHLQPALVTVPLCGAAYLLLRRRGRRRRLSAALLVTLTLAFLVPWTLRNHSLHGKLVFISTNGGFNLLKGNHAGATGGPQTVEERAGFEELKRERPEGLAEIESDAWYRRQALRFIGEHPGDYAMLALSRLRRWALPRHLLEPGSGWPVTFGTLFPFAALGLIVLLRRRATVLPPLILLAAVALPAVLVVYAGSRYRTPAMPIFAAFAGCGIEAVLGWIRRGARRLRSSSRR